MNYFVKQTKDYNASISELVLKIDYFLFTPTFRYVKKVVLVLRSYVEI